MKYVCALLILLLTGAITVSAQATVADGLIKLDSPAYEIAFRTADGSIASIFDKTTNKNVSTGDASLWTAAFDNNQQAQTDEKFSYTLDAASNRLTLTYSGAVGVTVTVDASNPQAIRMQAVVNNISGHTIATFGFPSNLQISEGDVHDALLPMLPGALLDTEFFQKKMGYSEQYPGVMFADYEALRSADGMIALYSQHEANAVVQPAFIGFGYDTQAQMGTITHNYKTWLVDQKSWTSPVLVIRVGQDYPATIAAYRTDTGIDQFPSIDAKLGAQAPTYFAAPMYKLDLNVVNLKFQALKSAVIDKLNIPGIIHLVTFQKGGHDTNYPDFIPPDPRWGTTQDFADLVSEIHKQGDLAVPYTNFSWWNLNSPTLASLPNGIELDDLVVSDMTELPDLETYGPKSGVVVDLNSPFVQTRIAQQHDALLRDVGVDGIFEDQFGDRDAPYDFNPSGLIRYDPSTTYFEGVINHFRDRVGDHLMTELGTDVLAQYATGFVGTNYLWDIEGYRTTAAYTSYYPMAGMLLRDKVLLYQHNLASQTWTKNIDMLRWNLTQGYGLSNAVFDETLPGLNMANPWLNLVGVFQKYALANYADQLVQSFDDLGNSVMRTRFSTYTVYSNWATDTPYTQDGNTLPPGGVVTEANDGSVIAGVFTAFDSQPLSDGDHYLVEVRSANEIKVFQPVGSDTTIHIPGWAKATVTAYQYDGTKITTVTATISGSDVSFDDQGTLQGQQVGYYSITPQ